MNKTKVAIIGGGASGLLSAVELIKGGIAGQDIVILERNDRVGKKLIATGNGQGNLTNENISKEFYHGDTAFIRAFIENYNKINLTEYFYSLGITLTLGEEGKIYPTSKQASAVLDLIRAKIIDNNVNVLTNAKVEKILREKDGYIIEYNGGKIFAEKVITAFGGSAGKQFGTDGSAYSLLECLGHKTGKLYPSLVQLKTETKDIKGLKGLKENAKVTVLDGENEIKSETGDLLFTDFGVSGSAIFKLSGYAQNLKIPILKIEFLPELKASEIEKILIDKKKIPYIKEEDILTGLINKIIGRAIIKPLKEKTPEGIAKALKDFRLKITGNTGFNNAQVTKGGILTRDIDGETYESKKSNGLYIVGEALDVDGDCGGYNLTFAFVSGITAAKNIAKKIKG